MELRIGKQSAACAKSGRSFQHGEDVVSVVKIENQSLVREDFAKEHWSTEQREGALAVWETQYVDPKRAEEQPPEAFSPLRKLFYDAVESDDRVEMGKAFLAAQLLRRQKAFRLIKESDEAEGEARIALFYDRIGERLVEVRDRNLTYAELESGRRRLLEELAALEMPDNPENSENEDVEREESKKTAD
jgi:hypothetical protein